MVALAIKIHKYCKEPFGFASVPLAFRILPISMMTVCYRKYWKFKNDIKASLSYLICLSVLVLHGWKGQLAHEYHIGAKVKGTIKMCAKTVAWSLLKVRPAANDINDGGNQFQYLQILHAMLLCLPTGLLSSDLFGNWKRRVASKTILPFIRV